jgi:hypothetical protein
MVIKVQFEMKFSGSSSDKNHTLIIAWKAIILSHGTEEGNATVC